jgi:hypothetical protein
MREEGREGRREGGREGYVLVLLDEDVVTHHALGGAHLKREREKSMNIDRRI